jgi:hypothetical protein
MQTPQNQTGGTQGQSTSGAGDSLREWLSIAKNGIRQLLGYGGNSLPRLSD